jgi:hypothetical protein
MNASEFLSRRSDRIVWWSHLLGESSPFKLHFYYKTNWFLEGKHSETCKWTERQQEIPFSLSIERPSDKSIPRIHCSWVESSVLSMQFSSDLFFYSQFFQSLSLSSLPRISSTLSLSFFSCMFRTDECLVSLPRCLLSGGINSVYLCVV